MVSFEMFNILFRRSRSLFLHLFFSAVLGHGVRYAFPHIHTSFYMSKCHSKPSTQPQFLLGWTWISKFSGKNCVLRYSLLVLLTCHSQFLIIIICLVQFICNLLSIGFARKNLKHMHKNGKITLFYEFFQFDVNFYVFSIVLVIPPCSQLFK